VQLDRGVRRRHRSQLRIDAGWFAGAIPLGLAGLTLVLVLINVWLVLSDQSRQAEVNQRQQYIEQSVRLGRVNANLVRALATAAVTKKDDKLRALLTEQGINVTYTPNAAATTGAAPATSGATPASGTPPPSANGMAPAPEAPVPPANGAAPKQ
jgi:hypothetical protein